ncbi:hypothetical protein [Stigmatella hybrida]|uniref:hypothetical protein n=1 Tax=Stigmatella hybrida TaxID=394097 RepID=UPI001CDAA074|nr:hypothetical protein [Stigmatella hybrida]
MTSPVGASGSRPISPPPSAGVQPGAPAAPAPNAVPAAVTTEPANPHLSDFTQTDRLRTEIGVQAQNNPSLYGSLVGTVNGMLQAGGYGISPASQRSVMENLRGVSQGTMPQSEAHFREARTFARDAFQSLINGRPLQADMELFGATINLIGGVGMSAVEGIQGAFAPRSPPTQGGGGGW